MMQVITMMIILNISRTNTKMKSTWFFGRRIFGKDAKPRELGILGVVLKQEEGVHHFAAGTKLAIGYADQPTKAKIMFCIHDYFGQPTKAHIMLVALC